MLKITTLSKSTDTKVYFKLALGVQGNRAYSKPLNKDLVNKISKSLNTYKAYLSVHADKSNNYKQLDYQWIEIDNAKSIDNAQKDLFIYGCSFYRETKKPNKDSLSITIYVDELSDDIISQIQWQPSKNATESTSKSKASSDTDDQCLFQ